MDVPEIIPLNDYIKRLQEIKLRSSLKWLVDKAYPNGKPSDLQDAFECDDNGSYRIKQTAVKQLVSSSLYRRCCSNIFANTLQEYQGHSSVFQILSRKGFYVVAPNESDVTEQVLSQPAPFKVAAHIAMIDSLMMAYASQTCPIEKVITAVKRFSPIKASSELPFDVEEALLFWMNKIGSILREKYVGSSTSDNNLLIIQQLSDISDGCNLLAVLAHYDTNFKLQDAIMRSSLDIADSLYNLDLVLNWCNKTFGNVPLSLNDMLYCEPIMRPNIIAFIAELFNYFENDTVSFQKQCIFSKTPFVKPNVSEATKKSFQNVAGGDENRKLSPMDKQISIIYQQTLLPLRKNSVNETPPKQAWSESRHLLDHVELSTEIDEVEPLFSAKKRPIKELKHASKVYESGEEIREKRISVPTNLSLKTKNVESEESSPSSEEYKTPSIETDKELFESVIENNISKDIVNEKINRNRTGGSSFVLYNRAHSPEEANKAGIPVVDDNKVSPKTSFAQIANCSASQDNDLGIVGSPGKKKKKTTFSLPNQTTWSQCAEIASNKISKDKTNKIIIEENVELQDIKLKLDQRRKLIEKERKKIETVKTGMRQQVGDTVFKQIVGKKVSHNKSAPASLVNSFLNNTNKIKSFEVDHVDDTQSFELSRQDSLNDKKLKKKNLVVSDKKIISENDSDIVETISQNYKFNSKTNMTNNPVLCENPKKENYSLSLEKLNSSLGELQEEILKLSLENSENTPVKINTPVNTTQLALATNTVGKQVAVVPGHIFLPKVANLPSQEKVSENVDDIIDTENNKEFAEKDETPGGFYISFGTENSQTVKKLKSKPRLSSETLTKTSSQDQVSKEISSNNNIIPIITENENRVSCENLNYNNDTENNKQSSPIGFVIESVETTEEVLEKKRLKLLAIKEKRLQEQEDKKLKLENERQRKALEEQKKKEEIELKRERDRQRRTERLQKYLDKKSIDNSIYSNETQPKKKPLKMVNNNRPKSQAFVADHDLSPLLKNSKSQESLQKLQDRNSSSNDLVDYNINFNRRPPSPLCLLKTKRCKTPVDYVVKYRNNSASKCTPLKALRPGSVPGSPFHEEVFSLPSPKEIGLNKEKRHNSLKDLRSLHKPDLCMALAIANRTGHTTVKTKIDHGRSNTEPDEYNGPKLFVKPSSKSNKTLIINAIKNSCLAGDVNTEKKEKVLESLAKATANHFIILFRNNGQQYKALYSFYPDTEDIIKISGMGPTPITNQMIDGFYKYNSGSRSFSKIDTTKHISVSIDAITIQNQYWQKRQSSTQRKSVPGC